MIDKDYLENYIEKKIIEPIGDKYGKKFGHILKRKPTAKAYVTRRNLVDILSEWKRRNNPGGLERVGANDFFYAMCDELNLVNVDKVEQQRDEKV